MDTALFTIVSPNEGESLSAFLKRTKKIKGDMLLFLSFLELEVAQSEELTEALIAGCKSMGGRIRLAIRDKKLAKLASEAGLSIVHSVPKLQSLLENHPKQQEALLLFSPNVWRQQLRSQLQTIGLLSLPRLRIWILVGVSVLLFFFVLFKLLPSAEISVWPREETVSQTANVFLVLSGSTVELPPRVKLLDLVPLDVQATKSLTYDQISTEFIGTNAKVAMTIKNESYEPYSLRKGSRLVNQAGMVFRIEKDILVDPAGELIVKAIADDFDIYNEVIGERGNVPANLRWEFIGLPLSQREKVYAINTVAAQGGTTAFRRLLTEDDIRDAKDALEKQLLSTAKQLADEKKSLYNVEHGDRVLEVLYYDELTKKSYNNFLLPFEFVGEFVTNIPVEGSIGYTAFAYDKQKLFEILKTELERHTGEGRRLLPESLSMNRLVVHVIDYDDDLTWVKITVDLSGTEQMILDPLTPTGARFAKHVRQMITGKEKDEAMRIVKNMQEVQDAEIAIWPPWIGNLPNIPSHIVVRAQVD